LGGVLFTTSLFVINRVFWAIGASTVAVDAPNAPDGFVHLLLIIASWDWRVLLVLAGAFLLVHLWLTYQQHQYIDAARNELNLLNNASGRLAEIEAAQRDTNENWEAFKQTTTWQMKNIGQVLHIAAAERDLRQKLEVLASTLQWQGNEMDLDAWRGGYSAWAASFAEYKATIKAAIPDVDEGVSPTTSQMASSEVRESGVPEEILTDYYLFAIQRSELSSLRSAYQARVQEVLT